MSLSAKQRILKLREAEFKLQKLQSDLLNGEKSNAASVTDFFAHHKELMSLPGNTKDSLPFRFEFEAGKRYRDVHQEQRLTLPPKTNIASIKSYKEPIDDSEKMVLRNSPGLARHPSLALQTFLNEIDKQSSKMAVGFPKLDKSLLNKTRFARSIQPLNSKRYVRAATASIKSQRSRTPTSPHQNNTTTMTTSVNNSSANNRGGAVSTSYLFLRNNAEDALKPNANATAVEPNSRRGVSKSTKVKSGQFDPAEVSKIASATASVLLATQTITSSSKLSLPSALNERKRISSHKTDWNLQREEELMKRKRGLAYALGTANLMGVILPQKGAKRKTNSYPWDPILSTFAPVEETEDITVKDALNLLRKRKLPQRRPTLPALLPPHRRGLIGVEISEFEPECAFFYRDRSGNYNPHLHHSKAVTESMKKIQMEANKSSIMKPV